MTRYGWTGEVQDLESTDSVNASAGMKKMPLALDPMTQMRSFVPDCPLQDCFDNLLP